jgi:putative nucleotidyltransferase with HDIG domain
VPKGSRETADSKRRMALELSLEEQELLADTLQRDNVSMSARELCAGVAATLGFVVAMLVLWLTNPPQPFAVLPAFLSFVVLVIATRVRFDTPFGFTVPTQLGFVPLVFSLPVAVAPVGVALALAIASVPDVARRRVPASRLLQSPVNAWFAVGPAAVFAVADVSPQSATGGVLIAALAAQFAVDFAISSALYTTVRSATLRSQLRELWVYGVDAALSGVALVVAESANDHPLAIVSLLPLLGLIALFAHERHQRLESLVELNDAYRGTALVLGDVVEADDGYTGQHCKSVVGLTLEVADRMGLDAEQRRNLEFGALLHDVGKIAIPKEIVNKPSKLNPEEWTIIKTHTVEGQKMLDRVGGFMRDVGVIVRSHHERWDGHGYPDGLVGDAIPLEARIITCCDSWNAMRTDRSYRKALPHEVAVAELRANSGSQFDPSVVTVLLEIVLPRVQESGPVDCAVGNVVDSAVGTSQATAGSTAYGGVALGPA